MNAEATVIYATLDDAEPELQMAAVDAAMRWYFSSENWIAARATELPGLRAGRDQR